MPEVMTTLRVSQDLDTRLAAIWFFKTYLNNTKDINRFVREWFELGMKLENFPSKYIFYTALHVVFDENTTDNIYRILIPYLATALIENIDNSCSFIIFKLLKHVNLKLDNESFRLALTDMGLFFYGMFCNSEIEDPLNNINCLKLQEFMELYKKKSEIFHFEKAFNIVEKNTFNRINSGRFEESHSVRAVTSCLYRNLRNLNMNNLPDVFKFLSSLILSSNVIEEDSGFDLLKDIILKMGFFLAPHLSSLIGVLRESLTSSNSKIKTKTEKLLNKLMHSIHPMTVIWELFKTNDSLQKEAIMRFILKVLKFFPYYCFDLISLGKYISCYMQDQNTAIYRASHDCMIMLLSIMRATPVSSIRVEASRLMMHNYNLQRGIEQIVRELDDQDDGESLSDDATAATLSTAQTSMTTESCVSLSAACSNAALQKVWKTDKDNPDSPTPSEILPQHQHRVFQPCRESKSFSRMKSTGPGDSRLLVTDIRHSNVDLPESKISLHRPKRSIQDNLGEQTVESTSSASSHAKSCVQKEQQPAKERSNWNTNIYRDSKTTQSAKEFFQKANIPSSHRARRIRGEENAIHPHMGDGDCTDHSRIDTVESDIEDENSIPFVKDEQYCKEHDNNESQLGMNFRRKLQKRKKREDNC